MDSTQSILLAVVARAPALLVSVAALVLAVARWQRHPTVSMLVTVAVVLQLAGWSVFVLAPRLGGALLSMQLVFTLGGLAGTAATALLVAAAFAERRAGSAPAGPPPGRS